MQINLRVVFADGTDTTVSATTPDLVDYEERFARSITALDSDLRYTDVCWLAWTSQRRTSATALEWREWLATVTDAAIAEVEGTPRPLARRGRRT